MKTDIDELLGTIRACSHCEAHLPLGPRPVLRAHASARILIIGQAPGTKVHATGIPWNDPSGDRLRSWMDVDSDTFYDERRFAIIPMGFCYPGKGKSGDLPPRPECAPLWHERLLASLPQIELTLLIGQYAQRYYLGNSSKKNLTETVRAFDEYLPLYLPLPHPSPRNQMWLRKNPWFEREVVSVLRDRLRRVCVIGLR
ncbi:MAG: uracil-DNA glycosylase family protein [Gammaproteobacteria bacterium]|nr:uracil-DNA glycosylase family protein [Gammaproteobacteria bacterium]